MESRVRCGCGTWFYWFLIFVVFLISKYVECHLANNPTLYFVFTQSDPRKGEHSAWCMYIINNAHFWYHLPLLDEGKWSLKMSISPNLFLLLESKKKSGGDIDKHYKNFKFKLFHGQKWQLQKTNWPGCTACPNVLFDKDSILKRHMDKFADLSDCLHIKVECTSSGDWPVCRRSFCAK